MLLDNIESVFEFAISEESEAASFYRRLADRVDQPALKKALEDFAREEDCHKEKLEEMRRSGVVISPPNEAVRNLAIADNLKAQLPVPEELDYRQALELAMSKEKAAFRLYTALAESMEDEAARAVFLCLAQEEAKHKLRFEIEYEDGFLDKSY